MDLYQYNRSYTHDGSMYAIYANIYHQYTPVMLAYISAPWILWVYIYIVIHGGPRPAFRVASDLILF